MTCDTLTGVKDEVRFAIGFLLTLAIAAIIILLVLRAV